MPTVQKVAEDYEPDEVASDYGSWNEPEPADDAKRKIADAIRARGES